MPSDDLSVQSRNFFERARVKLVMSLLVAALGLMMLGFCAYSGGQAQKYNLDVSLFFVCI